MLIKSNFFYPTKEGLKSKAVKILKPEKYVPPKPKQEPEPEPAPVPLPRPKRPIPKPTKEEIQKFIDKINPLYKPEAINAFQKILTDRKSLREIIKEKDRALKHSVKSFEVAIISRGDPAKQLYYTTINVERILKRLLNREKGLKAYVTLKIKFKRKRWGLEKMMRVKHILEVKRLLLPIVIRL